jgi:DNA topoisomerase-1
MSKIIHFSFLGKDSVKDERDCEVSDEVYSLLQKFQSGKGPNDQIFSHANSDTVNMFLRAIMPDITVKNLRTVKANQEFLDEAKRLLAGPKPKTEIEKIRILYLANKKVAEKLNHQKNVAKNFTDQSSKLKDKISLTKEKSKETFEKIKVKELELQVLEQEYKVALASQPQLLKLKLEEIKLRREALSDRKERTKKGLERAQFNFEKKNGTKDIALGTSLGAYLDSRIIFSLCKEIDLDPGKIYTKKQLELFDYAKDTDAGFWRSL